MSYIYIIPKLNTPLHIIATQIDFHRIYGPNVTKSTTLHKITTHTNIDGNEQANALANHKRKLDHRDVVAPYEHTPYTTYLHKDWWNSMQVTPNKGPIRYLEKHILNYDKRHNLATIANQMHQVYKWLENH